MTIQISLHDYWELLYGDHSRQSLDAKCPDRVFSYPRVLGTGYLQETYLRGGITLELFEVEHPEDVEIDCFAHLAEIEFSYRLVGQSQTISRINCQEYRHALETGKDLIYSGVRPDEKIIRKAGKQKDVCIFIPPELLRQLVESYGEVIAKDVEGAIEQTHNQPVLRPGTLNPTKQTIMHQILNCPYQGLSQKLYLESKVIELIAIKLAEQTSTISPARRTVLRPSEIEQIYDAKDVLIRELDNPPTISELAHQVGLNTHKLKVGFRQVFGTTVFGYFHAHRMEQAQILLAECKMSVTEVAYAVGYVSRGHFAAAYRKQFGINPNQHC